VTEKRYCIICGREIQSSDADAAFCPEHGRSPSPPQEQHPLQPKPQGLSPSPNIEAWQPGDVILDTYEIKEKLGKGGFGVVYRVHHKAWNIDLAVKRALNLDETNKQTFIEEAEKWIELGLHPHIISCLYVRMIDNFPHTFAELAEGKSLRDWIIGNGYNLYEGEPQQVLRRILDIAIQFAWGLAYAHEQGLVHQDVKPQNALMTPEGILKVTDFGLAKAGKKTTAGEGLVTMGGYTPAYCSPEQANRRKLSQKTDMWSWAVSVLEMFNGKVTWVGGQIADSALESYLRQRGGAPHIPPMPETLAELLRECLQRHPDNRPADMLTITEKLMCIYHQEIGQVYPREKPEPAELKADSLNNKALTMLDLGRPEQAEVLLEQAVAAGGQHVDATYNLGLLRWRLGRVTDLDVLQTLEQIRRIQPEDGRAVSMLGWVCLESGRFDKAVAYFEQATRLGGDSDSEHRLALARPLAESGTGTCLRTFEGHTGGVRSVAISPDGRQALSGSWDKTLKLWNLAKGECLHTFEGHKNSVESIAISPDGHEILSGSGDKTLKLWDLAKGGCLRTYKGHEYSVISVAISPDGCQALSGGDNMLKLWNTAKRRCLLTFEGHTKWVNSVAFSPDGRRAVSGSDDKTLKLWDLAKGECLRTFAGHTGGVLSVAISPDGRKALSGSWDETLKLWDMTTGRCLGTFEGHKAKVNAVAFSPDGRKILSGSGQLKGGDNTLRLWDISTGRCLRTFEGHMHTVNSVVISPDGRQALSGGADKALKLWDLAWLEENRYTAPLRYARGVAGSEAARYEQTHAAYLEQVLKALEKRQIAAALAGLKQARAVPGFERDIETLEIHARVGACASIKGFREGWLIHTFTGHTVVVISVAFSPDGRYALSGSSDKTLKLWDLAKGKCLHTFTGHNKYVGTVAISPDGHQVLSGSDDKTLKMWNPATGRCLRTFEGHKSYVKSVAFSPDGRQAISGSWDNTLKLWDLAKGECLRTYEGHEKSVFSVAISPDGCQMLSGSVDKTLKLWDLAKSGCLRTYEGHEKGVSSVTISPDGSEILSGSSDNTLKLWDLATGRCLRTFEGHDSNVQSVAFSPDGHQALSGSWDATLKLWDLATGGCLRTFEGHNKAWGVFSVAFSPDGRQALSGSSDKTLKLWTLDWEYEFPGWADWDEGARPYLANFLILHTPWTGKLPKDREPTEEEIIGALTRSGKPTWTEVDFQGLLTELGTRGYGWLQPEGVRQKLEELAGERG